MSLPAFMNFRLSAVCVLKILSLGFTLALPHSVLAQGASDFSAAALAQLPVGDWRTNGGNLANQRYSPLQQINRDNVSELKGVWHTRLRGSGAGPQYSGEAQPLVYDGIAYVITGADDVFAVSIDSGEILWQYVADLPPTMRAVCCGWTSRGVGMSDAHIYVGQLDGQLKALDRSSGEVVWAVQAERWQEGFTITSAPLYYEGLVITGFAGAERGIRGRIKAYDATSGALVWTFYTIPGPDEFGGDTWPRDNTLRNHGGASIWSTPAVDPELGMLYFATGNAAANNIGTHRAGDNLFTASILALDAATGTYRWHFQQVHHDIWDYDAPNPVMLFDIEIDGVQRKGLTQAGKTGWFYILDRVTGEPLIGIEERPVPQEPRQHTSATQPFPIGDAFVPQSMRIAPEGVTLVNEGRIFTPYWTEAIAITPGAGGGANWPPSAHDPVTGISYVCASDRPFIFAGIEIDDTPPAPGDSYTAGNFLGEAMYGFGVLAAVDMHTNKLVWQQHLKDMCFSGMTATAGGLVFVGRNDGRLTALDSSNGNKLWEFQTGAGMNAPVTVFEHQGRQHVIAYAAGNVLAGSAHGDSLWLFGLDGTLDPVPAPGSAMLPEEDMQLALGEPNLVAGKQIFETACIACHGEDGKGGHGGVDITGTRDFLLVAETVYRGRNTMPALGSVFTSEQLRDVAAYVSDVLALP
jgi:quinohemoprotein ethanol dehydrogenase